jgi:hypothetical protein
VGGVHKFEHCALVGRGQLGDFLEAVEEPGGLGCEPLGRRLEAQELVGAHFERPSEVGEEPKWVATSLRIAASVPTRSAAWSGIVRWCSPRCWVVSRRWLPVCHVIV